MVNFFFIFLLYFCGPQASMANPNTNIERETVQLDEELLLSFLNVGAGTGAGGNTEKQNSESQALGLELNAANFYNSETLKFAELKQFDLSLYSQLSYAENKQLPLISFQPIFSPERYGMLGLKQQVPLGFSWDFYVSTLQQDVNGRGAINNFKNVTTTTFGLNLELDLWQNFLGRQSRSLLQQSYLEGEESKIIKSQADKRFVIDIRKLYWSLVANEQSLFLIREILKISEQQWLESKKRQSKSLAESDEVSRYEAQYLGKKAALSFKLYQKEKLLQDLKRQLVQFSTADVVIKPVDIEVAQGQAMQCIKQIAQARELPLELTSVDEQIGILKAIQMAQENRISRMSDVDIKLFTNLKSTGVSSTLQASNEYTGSSSGAWNDLYQNDRWGHEIGLKVVLPLGENTSKQQEAQRLFQNKSKEVQWKRLLEELKIQHIQFKTMIVLLDEGVAAQDLQSKRFKNVITSMQKKYQQARVSLTDLLANQENYFEAELRSIDARFEVLSYLLDYLKLFPETKCAFNKF